jgi:hypothetical protein
MARRARRRVESDFSTSRMAAATMALYDRLLAEVSA